MSFFPSLQALIGSHTSSGGAAHQCAVDWVNRNVYIIGGVSPSGDNYLASVGLISGTEQVYALLTTYTIPMGTVGFLSGTSPVGLDALQQVYITWFGGNGGGLVQVQGSTLAQIGSVGNNAPPPSSYILAGGTISTVTASGIQYLLGTGPGSGASLHEVPVYNQITLTSVAWTYGTGITGSFGALSCPGKTGTNNAYVIYGPTGSTDTQKIYFNRTDVTVGNTAVASFIPTDINAGWSFIYPVGVCTDQTDGNILMWCQNSPTATLGQGAIVKLNATTGIIIWNCSIPGNAQPYNAQFAFSNIVHQKLAIVTGGVGGTITTIDTSAGSSSTSTTGMAGLQVNGYQCYNDDIGGIVCNANFSNTTGSPIAHKAISALRRLTKPWSFLPPALTNLAISKGT